MTAAGFSKHVVITHAKCCNACKAVHMPSKVKVLTLDLLQRVDCGLRALVGVLGLGEERGRGTGVEVPDGFSL